GGDDAVPPAGTAGPAGRVARMSASARILRLYDRAVLRTYARLPVAVVRGRGAWVWDADGRRYLDFFPGFGVGALGHCHPAGVRGMRGQAGGLTHGPNPLHHPGRGGLAGGLVRLGGFPGRVFFCNSGAETTEAAIKLARRWAQVVRGKPKHEIVTVLG